jgi:hypothetical protein
MMIFLQVIYASCDVTKAILGSNDSSQAILFRTSAPLIVLILSHDCHAPWQWSAPVIRVHELAIELILLKDSELSTE